MGWSEGMAMGDRWASDWKDEARQKRKDAWESEQQARQKQIWDREDKTRSDADAAMRDDPSAGYTPVDPYAAFGIQRRAVPAPQAPVGEQYGSGSVGAPGLAPQAQMAFPETGGYAQQKQKLLQSQLAAARAQGGMVGLQQFQKTQSEMLTSRMGEDAARIGHFVANAPEDEYQQLLSRVHVDKNNKYETTFDPKTKLTTLALGKESVQLSRADVGRYFEAMHRLKNGDSSAMGDLETIHKGLAAKVAEDLKLKEGMANTNNKAAEIGRKFLHDEGMLANDSAKLGLMREGEKGRNLRAQQDDWKLIGASQDNKGLMQFNSSTGATRTMPLPEGTDATGLFRKLTGTGGAAPMSKIEEEGVGYRDNATGRIRFADGRGGFIAEGGVMPKDRTTTLKKAGVPDNLIGSLPWSENGKTVGFAGQAYLVSDPADMRQLAKDYARISANTLEMEEAQKVDHHYMNNTPKTFGPSGSIYDTPEQRAAHSRAYSAR